jgi:hypothetical protein
LPRPSFPECCLTLRTGYFCPLTYVLHGFAEKDKHAEQGSSAQCLRPWHERVALSAYEEGNLRLWSAVYKGIAACTQGCLVQVYQRVLLQTYPTRAPRSPLR